MDTTFIFGMVAYIGTMGIIFYYFEKYHETQHQIEMSAPDTIEYQHGYNDFPNPKKYDFLKREMYEYSIHSDEFKKMKYYIAGWEQAKDDKKTNKLNDILNKISAD